MTTVNHLAIIMDGNGRWARERALPRLEGHRAGVSAVRGAVDACLARKIRYLTLYSFSAENWQRDPEEVANLMELFEHVLCEQLPYFCKHNVRLRVIGDRSRLPDSVNKAIIADEERTASFDSLCLTLAVSYGAREEITFAAKELARRVSIGELSLEQITPQRFSECLWTSGLPDPDLLIRTSGELRISNFLLWQLAYAELIFVPEYWPEFDAMVLDRCLEDFSQRERRYGLTSEQISQGLC